MSSASPRTPTGFAPGSHWWHGPRPPFLPSHFKWPLVSYDRYSPLLWQTLSSSTECLGPGFPLSYIFLASMGRPGRRGFQFPASSDGRVLKFRRPVPLTILYIPTTLKTTFSTVGRQVWCRDAYHDATKLHVASFWIAWSYRRSLPVQKCLWHARASRSKCHIDVAVPKMRCNHRSYIIQVYTYIDGMYRSQWVSGAVSLWGSPRTVIKSRSRFKCQVLFCVCQRIFN